MSKQHVMPDRIHANASGIYAEGSGVTIALPCVFQGTKHTLAVMEEIAKRYNAEPALLEACQLLIKHKDHTQSPAMRQALVKAYTAIAKATA